LTGGFRVCQSRMVHDVPKFQSRGEETKIQSIRPDARRKHHRNGEKNQTNPLNKFRHLTPPQRLFRRHSRPQSL
jgi:hypothetical protein